jgi:flagellar basal-body rod protein FlgB
MKIDDVTIKALAASVKMREMRQELLTSNIANAETPEYKAKRLDFEEALARAINVDNSLSLKTMDERHYDVGGGGFNNLQPEVYNDYDGVESEDGNNVDRDKELALMAQNKILYDASVELLKRKLSLLKYTVNSER